MVEEKKGTTTTYSVLASGRKLVEKIKKLRAVLAVNVVVRPKAARRDKEKEWGKNRKFRVGTQACLRTLTAKAWWHLLTTLWLQHRICIALSAFILLPFGVNFFKRLLFCYTAIAFLSPLSFLRLTAGITSAGRLAHATASLKSGFFADRWCACVPLTCDHIHLSLGKHYSATFTFPVHSLENFVKRVHCPSKLLIPGQSTFLL